MLEPRVHPNLDATIRHRFTTHWATESDKSPQSICDGTDVPSCKDYRIPASSSRRNASTACMSKRLFSSVSVPSISKATTRGHHPGGSHSILQPTPHVTRRFSPYDKSRYHSLNQTGIQQYSHGGSSEDVFFSLEDDEPQVSGEKIVPPPSNEVLESVVVLDPEIVEQATGCYTVEWPLVGMDCPDCAGKAMTALRILPQVKAPAVSATRGDVKLELDLEKGSLSEVSSAFAHLDTHQTRNIIISKVSKPKTLQNATIRRFVTSSDCFVYSREFLMQRSKKTDEFSFRW